MDDNDARIIARVVAIRTLKRSRYVYDKEARARCIPNDVGAIIANMSTNYCGLSVKNLRDDYAAAVGAEEWKNALDIADKFQSETVFFDSLCEALVMCNGFDGMLSV